MTKLLDLINEEKMTSSEKKGKEKIVKGMKKAKGDFKKRYGKDAKQVMYATATKRAMDEKKGRDLDDDGDVDSDDYLKARDIAIKKAKSKKMNENHLSWPPTQDHEATMAKGELRDMIENAAKVYKMIEPNQQLPGWVSAYITLASDYMHSIAEYLTEEEIQYSQNPDGE